LRTDGFLLAATLALAASVPAAGDGFIVVVNSSVSGASVRRADLAAVFMKKALRWGDGSPATPVDQSGTSPVRRLFSDSVLRMPVSVVVQYWQKQLLSASGLSKVPVVKNTDDEVLAYVARTNGSVGYVASGTTLPPGVKAVTIID
jgi:ABC-type phosphate transport system substrate-binding protein